MNYLKKKSHPFVLGKGNKIKFSCLILPHWFLLNSFFLFELPRGYSNEIYYETFCDSGRGNQQVHLKPQSEQKTYLFTINYGLTLSPFGNTIASQGFVMNLGLNLARFISKNIVLGINSDLKLSGGYFIKYGTSQFLNDFNSSFYLHYNNSLDSANSNIVRNAINKSPLNPITGSRLYNFGIMFSPFPFKYGGIMLQVRRGAKVFKIDVGNNPFVGGDNGYLEITKNWIYELMFKPLTFKKNKFPSTRHFNTSITFSVHYEKLNFGNAKFNGTSIRQMLSSDFINRYQFDNRFGFKIGLGFY